MFYNFHTHHLRFKNIEIQNLDGNDLRIDNYFSYGIHPFSNEIHFKEELLNHPKCLAIGEIGLDKFSPKPFQNQEEIFKNQILLSEKHKLPIIIHCVKSWNEIIKIKKEFKTSQAWIYHGFRKTNILKEVLENEFHVGIGAAILFDKRLQEIIHQIPVEKILLETDDSEVEIDLIYEKVSEILNYPLEKLQLHIEKNFRSIFKKYS